MINLDKKVNDWKNQTAIERFEKCRSMLYLHGFLTEKEKDLVRDRINKAYAKQQDVIWSNEK